MSEYPYYVPILASTSHGDQKEDISSASAPYNTPDFWSTVTILREKMNQIKPKDTGQCIPKLGQNRRFDQDVSYRIKRYWKNHTRNNFYKVQQIARLSPGCFALVAQIAADPARYTTSKRITSYSFDFLLPSLSDSEKEDILKEVLSGAKTIADLNKQKRDDAAARKSDKEKDTRAAPTDQDVVDLQMEIERLQQELLEERKSNETLRKNLHSEIETNEGLRKSLRINIDMLKEKIAQIEGPMLMATSGVDSVEEPAREVEKARFTEQRQQNVKTEKAGSRLLEKRKHENITRTVEESLDCKKEDYGESSVHEQEDTPMEYGLVENIESEDDAEELQSSMQDDGTPKHELDSQDDHDNDSEDGAPAKRARKDSEMELEQ